MVDLLRVVKASLVFAATACVLSLPVDPLPTGVDMGAGWVPHAPGGDVVTIGIYNGGDDTVVIAGLTFEADQGLTVRYLGWDATGCRTGCVGAGHWAEESTRKLAQQSVKGTFPLVVPPRRSFPVVLFLDVDPSAQAALDQHCLGVRSAIATLPDGRTFAVTNSERFVAGVSTSRAPNPPGYPLCFT